MPKKKKPRTYATEGKAQAVKISGEIGIPLQGCRKLDVSKDTVHG